jgi:predicted DCC family thiol-disulfide oxidoreductase YuxK
MGESLVKPPLLVLFDGPCALCNRFVNFIRHRDPNGRFQFAPLQSPQGGDQLAAHNVDPQIQSVVVIEGDKAFTRSGAVCRIAVELPDPWPLLGAAIFLPESLRDGLYDWVAANRKKWFGEVSADSCELPTGNEPSTK